MNTCENNESEDDEYVQDFVCDASEIDENEMKVFDIKAAGKVLLIRQKGKVYALGTECTHYGAPLVNGVLGDGRLRCQWHGACFNIGTGDIEDFPGLDSLPCHEATIENCRVKVRAKKSALQNSARVKPMSKKLESNKQHFVVIGGGPAGGVCVETLRQENFTGAITMISKESHLPYNRVEVSKTRDFDIEINQFRTIQFYQENDINVLLGTTATKVNSVEKKVNLENEEEIKYDKLFIATGSYAAMLNTPGITLKNIFTLRSLDDGKAWTSEFDPDKRLVIIGSSFIAMEAASCCIDKVKSVLVVAYSKVPFEEVLGERIGYAFMKYCETKGVAFRTNTTLKQINDNGRGQVGSVELTDGQTVETDILLFGVGNRFCTDFLKDSGIAIRADGSIEVDSLLRTNVTDVYVGGDIAYAPVYPYDNRKATIGHFALAHYHGKVAALNMLGKKFELRCVPYFWTSLFEQSIRYAGNGKFVDIVYAGDVNDLKFVAFYIDKTAEVIAVCSCGMDPYVSKFAELLHEGRKLYKKDLDESLLRCLSR